MVWIRKKTKERFNVTLEPKVVEDAKSNIGLEYEQGALSPVINDLLKVWIYYKKEVQELISKAKIKWGADNNTN